MFADSRFAPTRSFWAGRRVFLTGHTGFKGSWLALWLHGLGAEVRGYALAPPTRPSTFEALDLSDDIAGTLADIRDADRLCAELGRFRPEIVFHLAAQPIVRRAYQEPVETFATNLQGTVHLLDACRTSAELRAIVVVTTDKCYENREWLWPYREDEALGGHDPYSASKACAEIAARAYRRSFFGPGGSVALATARAGNVFGGGDWSEDRLLADAARAFAERRGLVVRNPAAIRPWQHVAEPLGGYLALARALVEEGQAFATAWNFGPPTEHTATVAAVATAFAGAWGEDARWEHQPQAEAPHEAGVLLLDSSRARARLGWRPATALNEGLAETAGWYRAFHAGVGSAALRALALQQIARRGAPDLGPIPPQPPGQ
jgi:CDP-glucose 4,6-dehydratase